MTWKQRFQPCLFCGEPLPGNWKRIVKKTRTGWALHFECDRTIAQLRTKDRSRISYDKFRRNLAYIQLDWKEETNGNVILYQ